VSPLISSRLHPTLLLLGVLVLFGGLPDAAMGQVEPTPGPLPPEVRDEVLDFLNAPTTLRLSGGSRIPAGSRIEGPLGVLGGALRVEGVVEGPVVVVNGDLHLLEGGRIEGEIVVVGGRILAPDGAIDEAMARAWSAPLRYRIRGDRVEVDDLLQRELPPLLEWDLGFANVRPTLRSAGNYNRTEGLPVELGPIFRTTGRNPTQVGLFAIWRSASGLELDRENLGHSLRIEQEMGGSGEARVGFAHESRISPIETRGLTNPETSLTTFLLHRDFRDYFESEGWSTYLELNPVNRPVRARITYTEADHRFAPIVNPWTLRDREAAWRAQPLVAEGSARSLSLLTTYDTRDDVYDPSTGWLVEGTIRRRVGGELRLPALADAEGASVTTLQAPSAAYPLATDGTFDLRRYNRLGPDTRLNFRLLLSGSVDGNPLPPQFQRAPGGEGSLPGHPRFALDCGARAAPVTTEEEIEAYPAYGCDRIGLFQVELQGYLPIGWSPDPERYPDWETRSLLEVRPAWALFAGVGRGSVVDDLLPHDLRVDSPTRADVGVGIFVGPLGLYWAYPLNRGDRGLNFFVRLGHRF
jgi:hypothetical protein